MMDVKELEVLLKRRSEGIHVPGELRERVRNAARREAASGSTSGGWWEYAAGLAAAVLIGANLAVTAPSGVYFDGSAPGRMEQPAVTNWPQMVEQMLRDDQS